jgi:hypothetical protein
MTFELIGYTNNLSNYLRLNSHGKGFIRDLLVPCKARDFAAIKDEYIRSMGAIGYEDGLGDGLGQ